MFCPSPLDYIVTTSIQCDDTKRIHPKTLTLVGSSWPWKSPLPVRCSLTAMCPAVIRGAARQRRQSAAQCPRYTMLLYGVGAAMKRTPQPLKQGGPKRSCRGTAYQQGFKMRGTLKAQSAGCVQMQLNSVPAVTPILVATGPASAGSVMDTAPSTAPEIRAAASTVFPLVKRERFIIVSLLERKVRRQSRREEAYTEHWTATGWHSRARRTLPSACRASSTATIRHYNTHLSMPLKGRGFVDRDAVPWGVRAVIRRARRGLFRLRLREPAG